MGRLGSPLSVIPFAPPDVGVPDYGIVKVH